MEYMMMKRRMMMRRRILRLMVIIAVYAGLLLGAVAMSLCAIWLIKNTVYGLWILLAGCMLVGGWMFFRLTREECVSTMVQYS